MKTDREFLDGMWDKVSQMEYEETQRKAAKARHKRIIMTNVAIVLSILAAFAFIVIGKPEINTNIFYITATLSLTAAYWLDKFISGENKVKSERKGIHEN